MERGKALQVTGDSSLLGNAAITQTLAVGAEQAARTMLHVQGTSYFSSEVGINTMEPNASLGVVGPIRGSSTAFFGESVGIGAEPVVGFEQNKS